MVVVHIFITSPIYRSTTQPANTDFYKNPRYKLKTTNFIRKYYQNRKLSPHLTFYPSSPNKPPPKKKLGNQKKKNTGIGWAAAGNRRDLAAGLRSMDPVAAVLAILAKLQSVGFCADLRISDAAAASDPSEAFDAVLATFLREVYLGGREARPIPAALGDGRCVDLLRLFLAVRAAGGYAGVTSSPRGWVAAAESAGVDGGLAAAVKILYAKYLGALDRWIQRLEESHGPFLCSDKRKRQKLFNGSNGVEEGVLREQPQHVMLKRKRGDMVGMLGWVREIAENAGDDDTVIAGSVDEYRLMALTVRKVVTRKRVRRASMLIGSHFQVISIPL